MNRRTFGQTLLGMLAVCGIGRAATIKTHSEKGSLTANNLTLPGQGEPPINNRLHTKCLTHHHIHENIPVWRAERVMESGHVKWISYQRDSNGQWVRTIESCNFPVCPCVQFKRAKA